MQNTVSDCAQRKGLSGYLTCHFCLHLVDYLEYRPILSIRFLLDTKLIAVQRSSTKIQLWNRETREVFSHTCRSESENILGFFGQTVHFVILSL